MPAARIMLAMLLSPDEVVATRDTERDDGGAGLAEASGNECDGVAGTGFTEEGGPRLGLEGEAERPGEWGPAGGGGSATNDGFITAG